MGFRSRAPAGSELARGRLSVRLGWVGLDYDRLDWVGLGCVWLGLG